MRIAAGSVKQEIPLKINNVYHQAVVRPADTLLQTLREELGLTGTKSGCENGDCGTCTVIVDDWPIKSCLMLTMEAVGKRITTIEGLNGAPIQHAFVEKFAFQCGYCTPGFLMLCHALVNKRPDANEKEIEEWLQSNLCRCTSYAEIREAVLAVLSQQKV